MKLTDLVELYPGAPYRLPRWPRRVHHFFELRESRVVPGTASLIIVEKHVIDTASPDQNYPREPGDADAWELDTDTDECVGCRNRNNDLVLRGWSVLDRAGVYYPSSLSFRQQSELHVYVETRDATVRLALS